MNPVTLGEALTGKDNALNMLRLAFALAVIAAHSYAFTVHPIDPVNLGSWAVAGFFAISGYLIPQSRTRTSLRTFVARRARRIYPGFWGCLVVTAFVLSPIAARLAGTQYQPGAAVRFVLLNINAQMSQYVIGPETMGTRSTYHEWNGSAWTLIFEVICYLVAGILLSSTLMCRHETATAAGLLGFVTVVTVVRGSGPSMLWFTAFFAAGWVLATRRARIRPTWAKVCLALMAGTVATLVVGPTLAALPLAYGVLAAGALIPARWFATNDISYGTYLYGWPMQQLLLIVGADTLGLPLFIAAAFGLALAAGAASWFLLERRCLPRTVRPNERTVIPSQAVGQAAEPRPPAASPAFRPPTRRIRARPRDLV